MNQSRTFGNVASMTCRVEHLPTGRACLRQRGHDGGHIAQGEGAHRIRWTTCDAIRLPYPGVPCTLEHGHPGDEHEYRGPDGNGVAWSDDDQAGPLDELAETFTLETTKESRHVRHLAALIAVVFFVALLIAPAVVIGVWRWAL